MMLRDGYVVKNNFWTEKRRVNSIIYNDKFEFKFILIIHKKLNFLSEKNKNKENN